MQNVASDQGLHCLPFQHPPQMHDRVVMWAFQTSVEVWL